MAKRKSAAAAADSAPAPAPVASGDYEGKQHYPRALYSKNAKGEVVQRSVKDAEAHAALEAEDQKAVWTGDLASLGVETHPAAEPLVERIK